jgi:hypothetical protein
MAAPESLPEFLGAQMLSPSPLLRIIVEANAGAILRLCSEQIRPEAAPLMQMLREHPAMSLRRAVRFRRCLPLVVQDMAWPDQQAWPLEPGSDRRKGSEPWVLDFRQPRHRLALLPEEHVLRLARYFGLVRFRGEITGLIRREDILNLRAEVGEEGHIFALHRTALLSFPTNSYWSSASPSASSLAELETSAPLALRVRRSGFLGLAACLADAPETVFRMARRASVGEFTEILDAARRNRPDSNPWPMLRNLLCKEVIPAWAPCFS